MTEVEDRAKCKVAVDADEAFAKLDRREVALAGGAQAHDEAQGAGRDIFLDGCGTIEGLNSAADCRLYSLMK